ncbi:MAG: fructose-6-phosphate aldolase, partial [Chlamydiia bacterium]|nr:fructose-6-phosphate aldolase [Chlamydiia bacterium]
RQSGHVAVQVTASDAATMVKQAEALYSFSNRIRVKVPVTGEGLQAIRIVTTAKIPVIATAVVAVPQVLFAALAGATYIAPYYSRMCEDDMNGTEILNAMLRLIERYGFPAKLLVSSLQSKEQVEECAALGAHAITIHEKTLKELVDDHPSTQDSLHRFSKDWEKAAPRRTLPL